MIPLALLFWTFFKISLFSIGGGYNMVPLMQHEVETREWLPAGRFMDVLAVSESTPGPIAVNLATFAGYQVAGIPGAVVATAGVCLPGFMLLMAAGMLATRLREKPAFRAAMRGVMPGLAGLLSATAIRLGLALGGEGATMPAAASMAIFAASLAWMLWKRPHPLSILATAALAGMAWNLA